MKIKVNNTTALSACVLILSLLCLLSVGTPIRFDKQRAKREAIVKHRLLKIRAAEEAYRARHGAYAGTFDALVNSKLLADSLVHIPFSGKKQFRLQATTIIGKNGKQIPAMECGAEYADYLNGLDESSVSVLTEEAAMAGRYPGLKIGDLETPNNNAGNWE